MRSIIGFCTAENKEELVPREAEQVLETPVRSVVEVCFPDDGRTFPYYNDRFDLKEGDAVFVDGKLFGKLGIVESVTTRFKVDLSYYKKVIARPDFRLHGTFAPMRNFMVCTGSAEPSPELFRTWIKPPCAEDDAPSEIVCGEGYELDLASFERDDDAERDVLERAIDYCREGRVRYVSLRNGVGTAFVKGSKWYEVNFRYESGHISDLYCECPYPGLCKHALAVLFVLRMISERIDAPTLPDLTVVESRYFQTVLSISRQSVSV